MVSRKTRSPSQNCLAQEALDRLRSGELDAAFLVLNPLVTTACRRPYATAGLELMSLADAEALARRHRFLSTLKFAERYV